MILDAASLKSLVDEWLRLDPVSYISLYVGMYSLSQNSETRNEIQRLWDKADESELERRLR
jgi:hypothetical protein